MLLRIMTLVVGSALSVSCTDSGGGGRGDANIPADGDSLSSDDDGDPGDRFADLDTCFAGIDVAPGQGMEILTLAAPGVMLRVARETTDEIATGETMAMRLDRFALQRGSEVACVVAAGEMDYAWSYHNWFDTASVVGPENDYELKYLRLGYLNWDFPFRAMAKGTDTTLWQETDLVIDACSTIPPDNMNFCAY